MRRLQAILTIATVAALLAGSAVTYRWYKASSVLKIAVASDVEALRPFLESLAASRSNLSFVLIPVSDNAAALSALRSGAVQLAAARIDGDTRGNIRSVALLSTRYLLEADKPSPQDADLAFAGAQLSSVLGRTVAVTGLDIRAARRLGAAPRSLLTRTGLKISDDQADRLWFLGAAKEDPEDEDDWRGRALSVSRMLVTTESTDRQLIHDVAMQITDVVRSIRGDVPAARDVTIAPIDETKSIVRAHDGIARFVNREGQAFFERYGDLVYVGMSLLGVVLTAVGGLIAWLHFRIADNGRRYLTRMQILVRRAAQNPQEADRIRVIATRLSIRFAGEVAARRIAHDVLDAFEVMQRTLGLWLEPNRMHD